MMINYDDMSTEELKNLHNELAGVINERFKEERKKAIKRANILIAELKEMMEEYDFKLEVEDWNDDCCIKTFLILDVIE